MRYLRFYHTHKNNQQLVPPRLNIRTQVITELQDILALRKSSILPVHAHRVKEEASVAQVVARARRCVHRQARRHQVLVGAVLEQLHHFGGYVGLQLGPYFRIRGAVGQAHFEHFARLQQAQGAELVAVYGRFKWKDEEARCKGGSK